MKAPPGFQPLNLTCDLLVSNVAFKWVNLYRYTAGAAKFLVRKIRDENPGGAVQVDPFESKVESSRPICHMSASSSSTSSSSSVRVQVARS
jgi:hypothetical protein